VTHEQLIYGSRFSGREHYRERVWKVLVREIFQPLVAPSATILDLGCGYGEFINNVRATKRYAMDANPDARLKLAPDVEFIEGDSSQPWPLAAESIDVIFTSNFFEHLETKRALHATLEQARLALRPGGILIAVGPNARYIPGAYWDFIDHHIALTDRSLVEAMEMAGFSRRLVVDRFLPYTMSDGNTPDVPLFLVEFYLRAPLLWRVFGKQFLIVMNNNN
jgi:SAM-dependent methyltransferase